MVTKTMMGRESRGSEALKGEKEGILRGPDLSQHKRGFSFRQWTEHESPKNGQVGQKEKGLEVNPNEMSSSVQEMKVAMAWRAEIAGGQSTTVGGMLE